MNSNVGHDLKTVLKLSPKEISLGLAMFYIAYVVFDVPSNLLMTRLSPRIWMSRIVFSIGILGLCFAFIKAAWSLYLLRFLLGVAAAGLWPGMAYYLTLFYPPSRTGKRIGMYFTASQLSAAVIGLVSAGFQKMDGARGLVGFQWMFLLWGVAGTALGIALLWWLPERVTVPGQAVPKPSGLMRFLPPPKPALKGEDAEVHYRDLSRVYHVRPWTMKDLWHVLIDWRLLPLTLMYFGVVGVGNGTQLYATVIISGINPSFSGVTLSLLVAPIWICDLIAILLVTPISDRFHRHRALFFSLAVCVQITGILMTTLIPVSNPWARYAGLLLVGFGLGPTVPITMTWSNEVFQRRHGEVGVAAASALVSGLGNLGSVVATYALYTGWPEDAKKGPLQFRKSSLVMVGILCMSILSSVALTILLKLFGCKPAKTNSSASSISDYQDGAAKRELEQRGFKGMWWNRKNVSA